MRALFLVAGLAAGCAVQDPPTAMSRASQSTVSLAPVPASALVADPRLRFLVAGDAGHSVTLYHDAAPRPVAVAAVKGTGFWLRDDLDCAVRNAAIEHLYTQVFRMDPLAAAWRGTSQAAVLRDVAAARDPRCAVARWQVVTLQAHDAPPAVDAAMPRAAPGDGPVVAVRVRDTRGPVVNARVAFNRAPHHGCVALSDAAGVARCLLIDTHGDAHEAESDEAPVPVVATYPGEIAPHEVLLPTTRVLP